MDKKQARLRRARKTRGKIAEQLAPAGGSSAPNCHIYAQIFAPDGTKVLASASTLEAEVRARTGKSGGNRPRPTRRQAHRRKGEGAGYRHGGVRPLRIPLSWPRQGAGRSRP